MARKILTGDKELEATLKALSDKVADRIAKSCLSAGLTVIAREMKKAAPVGATGALKASIGKRNEKNKRGGVFTAKAGINVGKMSKKIGKTFKAPHSHLVALGTKQRTRKTIGGKFAYLNPAGAGQLLTGTMPSNPFIKIAYQASQTAALAKMKKQAAKKLATDAAKVSRKSRSYGDHR